MAFLAPKTAHLGNGYARNSYFVQRCPDVVELERFDNGGDQFHC
jgi:hypothetical protein